MSTYGVVISLPPLSAPFAFGSLVPSNGGLVDRTEES
jgi:hypothetical protein